MRVPCGPRARLERDIVARRAGSLLNYAELSRSLGIQQTTLKRYFALLEATFLVQPLAPWSGNIGNRAIRTPKVYINDTGLLAHLLGLTPERLEIDPTLAGGILENFVLMELRKQSAWNQTPVQFFVWCTASGQEVDIVMEDRARAAGKRWIRGVALYTGTEVIPFGPHLHGVPISHLWAPD